LVSAGVHPFGLDHRDGRRAHQVGDERLGRFRLLAVGSNARGIDNFALQFRWERSHDVQAGVDQYVEGKHCEFGAAVGNGLRLRGGTTFALTGAFELPSLDSESLRDV
jgi:hypothetical protein